MDDSSRREVQNLLRRCVLSILRQIEQSNGNNSYLGNAQFHLEWLINLVLRIEHPVVDLLSEAHAIIVNNSHEVERNATTQPLFSGAPGRPKLNITQDQIEFLLERRFTVLQMSRLLGVSSSTIERRMAEFRLTVRGTYANISDEQLDATVREILVGFPNTGYKRMTGHLRSRGIRIQQSKIQDSMRRVDPQGILIHALEMNIINRRVYSVPSPLALWHIGGNHKLIRYQNLCTL